MFRHPTLHKRGLTTILLVLLLAVPGTAIASEGGGGGDGGGGGESRDPVFEELQDTKSQKEALERELNVLSSIDLDGEMGEFFDKKKHEARIKKLAWQIEILSSKETDLTDLLDRMTERNWIRFYSYIRYFTLEAYLGLPSAPFEAMVFQDPLALYAFQIVVMTATFDPIFRAYFESRYGYLFEE